jgi:hypothetical protein
MSGTAKSGRRSLRTSMSYFPPATEYVNTAITNIYLDNGKTFDNLSTEFISRKIIKSILIGFNIKPKRF